MREGGGLIKMSDRGVAHALTKEAQTHLAVREGDELINMPQLELDLVRALPRRRDRQLHTHLVRHRNAAIKHHLDALPHLYTCISIYIYIHVYIDILYIDIDISIYLYIYIYLYLQIYRYTSIYQASLGRAAAPSPRTLAPESHPSCMSCRRRCRARPGGRPAATCSVSRRRRCG